MPGVSQGNHRPGTTQPCNRGAATSTHVSVGGDQDDLWPTSRGNSSDMLEHGVDVGSPCVPHRGLTEIVALELRYDGGEGKDLELSAHEGFAARGREIGQAGGHRSADPARDAQPAPEEGLGLRSSNSSRRMDG
jgi:hypothetical protein